MHRSLRGSQTELAIRLFVVREPRRGDQSSASLNLSAPVCTCPIPSLAQSSPSLEPVLSQSSSGPLGPRHSSDALCVSAGWRSRPRSLRLAQHHDAEAGTVGPLHDRVALIPTGSDGSCRARLSRSHRQGGPWPDMSCVIDATAIAQRRANFAPIAHRPRTDLARRRTACLPGGAGFARDRIRSHQGRSAATLHIDEP